MFTISPSFPPIDDLIEIISRRDYAKHIRTFINVSIIIVAFVAAVTTALVQRFARWYQQGGKEYLWETYQKVKDVCIHCYLWVRCEGYPELLKFRDEVQQTYRAWRDLVTV